jgi:hypothetical protein
MLAGLMAFSCVNSPSAAPKPAQKRAAANAEDILAIAMSSCFEVVTQKANEDPIAYDKPLNWELVDYNVRNDKYLGLGTAFAIGKDRLVTAAHVLDLCPNSLVYQKRFIREKRKEGGKTVEAVYEIGEILGYSGNRDFAIFNVKGKTFSAWLETEESYRFNERIFTAGNAFGEGIVVREGLLLDETPESEKGEWSNLKSSIATNPGNSGGPLLNERGKVIGIVLAKKDDFCYSLPVKEMSVGKAVIHHRSSYGFDVFDKRKQTVYDRAWDCPLGYLDLSARFAEDYGAYYRENMDALLDEHGADMFPNGVNSEKALFNMGNAFFPQLYLQDSTNGSWFLTDNSPSGTDIGNGGSVRAAETFKDSGTYLMRLDKPKGVSVRQLWDDPKLAMDLILKGINITRKLSQSDAGSRVLSYGKPFMTKTLTDRWDRTWQANAWILPYSDLAVLTMALPTPKGLDLFYVARSSSQLSYWLYDIGRMVDYVNLFYYGTLEQWSEFLSQKDLLHGSLKSASLAYAEGKGAELSTPSLALTLKDGVFKINKDVNLFLEYDVFLKGGKPVWDLRKVVADAGNAGNSYVLAYRWCAPTSSLPDAYKDQWKNAVIEPIYPYDRKAYAESGRTNIGSLHPAFVKDGASKVDGDHAYAIFVSKDGKATDAEMETYLKEFGDNLILKD